MTKEEFEEKMTEYRLLEQKHQVMTRRREELTMRLGELKGTIESIGEIEKNKKDEMFFPIGAGVFVPVKLDLNKKIVIGTGSDIVLKQDFKGVKDMLDERLEVFEKGLKSIEKEMHSIEHRIMELEPELRAMMEK